MHAPYAIQISYNCNTTQLEKKAQNKKKAAHREKGKKLLYIYFLLWVYSQAGKKGGAGSKRARNMYISLDNIESNGLLKKQKKQGRHTRDDSSTEGAEETYPQRGKQAVKIIIVVTLLMGLISIAFCVLSAVQYQEMWGVLNKAKQMITASRTFHHQ
jgi:hypothetical protein